MTLDFFGMNDLNKFYRDVALKVMGVSTALTVIVLSARQLPREFETRTIYPLLAKPVSRVTFLAGKLAGVMLAGAFCFGLFMTVYVVGTLWTGGVIPWALFLQYVFLQMIMLLILATLGFWLSMMLNLDAAITFGVIFYASASTLTTMSSYLYGFMDAGGRLLLTVLTFIIPQLTLFDLSTKTIHAEAWGPIGWQPLAILTVYGLTFALIYFALATVWFRRRVL